MTIPVTDIALPAGLTSEPTVPLLLLKITLLLAAAWGAYGLLGRSNPRWRVLLWRASAIGILATIAMSFGPPFIRVSVPKPKWAAEQAAISSPSDRAESARTTSDEQSPGVVRTAESGEHLTERQPRSLPRSLQVDSPAGHPLARQPVASSRDNLAAYPGEMNYESHARSNRSTSPPGEPTTATEPAHTANPIYAPQAAWAVRADWKRGILFLWLAGVCIGAARIGLGLIRIRTICRRARPLSEPMANDCRRVIRSIVGAVDATVLASPDVRTPCLTGILRPVILLPVRQSRPEQQRDLAAILAHEAAHLKGRDVGWNSLLHLLSLLLWFHPLAWPIRTRHAAACDAVCDAIAAEHVGDVASYSSSLARLALEVVSPPPAAGLAMARTSDVRGRVAALHRMWYRQPLSRPASVGFLLSAGVLATLLGVLSLTVADSPVIAAVEAEKPAATAAAPSAGVDESDLNPGGDQAALRSQITFRSVAARSGESLPGVAIRYQGRADGKLLKGDAKTNADGAAVVEWPPEAEIDYLSITARHEKFVPIHIRWDGDKHPVRLPAEKQLRFESGRVLGGRVQSEAGEPIAGAKLTIRAPATEYEGAYYVFQLAEPTTDADGRWQIDTAPDDLANISLRVEHPDYLQMGMRPSKGLSNLAVLKQGATLTGQVFDSEGGPIGGASVGFRDRTDSARRETTTDDAGRFTLKNCKPGRSALTVQAKGFAPSLRELTAGDQDEPIEFRMESGSTLQGRVVDVEGRPVAGAFVAVESWRGHRTISFRVDTDAEGRFEWNDAPADRMLFSIGKSGYMSNRDVALTPAAEPYELTLHPQLVVSGRVSDAETGEAIARFRVIPGLQFPNRRDIYWQNRDAWEQTDGRFTARFDYPRAGHFVKIEADGYRPFESRAFKSTEGEQTLDVALERQNAVQTIDGVVLLPDGNPAAGVPVALGTREMQIQVENGYLRRDGAEPRTKTGDDGKFRFTRPDDKFIVMSVADAGVAYATSDDFEKPQTLRLQPWGRVEGRVTIGARPGAGEQVSYGAQFEEAKFGAGRYAYLSYTTQADKEGRFLFERVVPGSGSVWRAIVVEFPGGSAQHSFGWQQPLTVEPGETTSARIGGTGRPVVGQVQLDRRPAEPIEWKFNSPVALSPQDPETGKPVTPYRRYLSAIDAEGRFRIEDVPPGTYALGLEVNQRPDPDSCGTGAAIGGAKLSVSVPDPPVDRPHEPFDVGTVTAELFDTLDVGEPAPDFLAQGMQDEPIRLRELHGKLVLVDFWATWCAPCLAEIPTLKQIQNRFGEDPWFTLLSLSCDNDVESPREYVRKHELDWLQGHVGSLTSKAPQDYTVRSLPGTFLIGPDGRVLAKNLRGKELVAAVAAALKDEGLFLAAADSKPPARFPIVRFEAPADVPALAKPPAVILLDDSDPDYDGEEPRRDRLTFLSADGEELRVIDGLNNAGTVGGVHGVALDAKRGRIYARENVANRVTAFDLRGRKLWQLNQIDAGALAVDLETGHLWCSRGSRLNQGETVVFDDSGSEVAAFPHPAVDLEYDAKSGAFWLVGYHITKIDRDGKVLLHRPVDGWACVSASVNPTDGSVWIAERGHPDVARSKSRLWHLDSAGEVLREVALGERDPYVVECDPQTGDAWAGSMWQSMFRVTPAGEVIGGPELKAVNIAFGPSTQLFWIATETELLGLTRDGKTAVRHRLHKPSKQAWLVAF